MIFNKSDRYYAAFVGAMFLTILLLIFWGDRQSANTPEYDGAAVWNTGETLLLDGVVASRFTETETIAPDTTDVVAEFLRVYVKRQLVLDKDQLGDCGGANLPPSLKPFRTDLLALPGVENVDIRAYEMILQKARAYSWEELEQGVKELIEKQYPFIAVKDSTKEVSL